MFSRSTPRGDVVLAGGSILAYRTVGTRKADQE